MQQQANTPMPRSIRSKRGKATEFLPAKMPMSCFSYSSATSSGSLSWVTSMVWICSRGMPGAGILARRLSLTILKFDSSFSRGTTRSSAKKTSLCRACQVPLRRAGARPKEAHHLSHCTPSRCSRPPSVAAREPPLIAILKEPRLPMASSWLSRTKSASDLASSSLSLKL